MVNGTQALISFFGTDDGLGFLMEEFLPDIAGDSDEYELSTLAGTNDAPLANALMLFMVDIGEDDLPNEWVAKAARDTDVDWRTVWSIARQKLRF